MLTKILDSFTTIDPNPICTKVPGAAAAGIVLHGRPHYEGDLEEPRLRIHLRGGPEGALQLPQGPLGSRNCLPTPAASTFSFMFGLAASPCAMLQ